MLHSKKTINAHYSLVTRCTENKTVYVGSWMDCNIIYMLDGNNICMKTKQLFHLKMQVRGSSYQWFGSRKTVLIMDIW